MGCPRTGTPSDRQALAARANGAGSLWRRSRSSASERTSSALKRRCLLPGRRRTPMFNLPRSAGSALVAHNCALPGNGPIGARYGLTRHQARAGATEPTSSELPLQKRRQLVNLGARHGDHWLIRIRIADGQSAHEHLSPPADRRLHGPCRGIRPKRFAHSYQVLQQEAGAFAVWRNAPASIHCGSSILAST